MYKATKKKNEISSKSMYSSNDGKNDTFSQEILETGRTLCFKTFS